MPIPGHQTPGKAHGRICFGSRNGVAVGQQQGGGQVRGDGLGEPGCVARRLRVSDAETVSCLPGSDSSAKNGLEICLHPSNGWRLVILVVSCPRWQCMTRKASIPDHVTQAVLPRSEGMLDHAEWVLALGKDMNSFRQKPVAAGVRSCTLAAVVATELMRPESLSTPSAALSRHTTGCPSRSGASPDFAPQPCSRGFATVGLRPR